MTVSKILTCIIVSMTFTSNIYSMHHNNRKMVDVNVSINTAYETIFDSKIQCLQEQIDSLQNEMHNNKKIYIRDIESCKDARKMLNARLNNRCREEILLEDKIDKLNDKFNIINTKLTKHINKLKQKNNKGLLNKKRKNK
ncbi:MAG: hypothetical protein IJ848_01550 [Alphaproteobacteria bacterium]|nr:hypothetical protein [Alphaproteobacteria bacterium]